LGHGKVVSLTLAGVPAVVVIAKVLGLYDRDELVLRKSPSPEGEHLVAAEFAEA
jgi:hypothetical protein